MSVAVLYCVAAVFVIKGMMAPKPERDIPTAESFVDALSRADRAVAGPGGRMRSGFLDAYEQLTPARRDDITFDAFFEEWNGIFDRYGMIVDRDHVRGASAGLGRSVSFRIRLGGDHQEHVSLTMATLKVGLTRLDGKWRVSSWTFVPNELK